jgi:hypothetical protein
MTLSFSAAGLAKTVNTVVAGERDIKSNVLSRYHVVKPDDERDLANRYETSAAFRESADLPAVPASSFLFDTSSSGVEEVFTSIVASAGIEPLFVEDLIKADAVLTLPTKVGAFIVKESRKIPLDNGALVAKLAFKTRLESLHLTEEDPYVLADEDKVIYRKASDAYNYIRQLIR